MTNYYFSEEHELFRSSLKDFLKKEVLPNIDQWEDKRQIPKEIWKKMGDMGFLGLSYPEKYGGLGLDFFYDVVFTEEVSKMYSGGFAANVSVVQYMSGPYILKHGSAYLKEKYLPGITAGEIITSIAITEPGAGSDAANIQTKARLQGDHYLVNGSKTFITNAFYGDLLICVVKTNTEAGNAGVSLLLIDRNAEGVSATKLKKLGWHASDTAELAFDNVKVPKENLLGEEGKGFYYLMGGLQLERLVGAVMGYAACEEALNYALKYMSERKAFGRTINKFQVLRHRVAQLATEIEACKQFVLHCCRMNNDGHYAVKESSMAKLLASELSDKVMYQCLQFFGGYGYMEEYKIARMFRDSRIGTIGGGSSEIMREIIAKMVIEEVSYKASSKPSNGKNNGNLSLNEILPTLQSKAKTAKPLGSTLKFNFGDQQLYINGQGALNQISMEDKEAACLVNVSLVDFNKMMNGELNPMNAVMSGKLDIKGDMNVAMKLQSLFN